MKITTFLLAAILGNGLFAQEKLPEKYASTADALKNFSTDTTAVPDDALTSAIRELRNVRGGLNIGEAIILKIREEAAKGKLGKDDAAKTEAALTTGAGAKKLENAVIWIYRRNFTPSEIQDMTAFYRTPAGRKMSEVFPVVILESLKAAEMVMAGMKKP